MNFVFINNEILFSNMLLILLEEPIKCLLTVTRLKQQSPDFLFYSTPKKNNFLIPSFTIKCNTLDFWSQIHWVVPERKKERNRQAPQPQPSSPVQWGHFLCESKSRETWSDLGRWVRAALPSSGCVAEQHREEVGGEGEQGSIKPITLSHWVSSATSDSLF